MSGTSTSAARDLVGRVRGALAPLEQRLFAHPYVTAVEKGSVSRDALRRFAAQQQRIITSDVRSVALMVHRHGGTSSGAFFAAALQTELAALAALEPFARALGASEGRLGDARNPGALLAGALAYTHFVAWMALYASDAEFAAAFLVNLPAWGANCGRLAVALRTTYGLPREAVAFFELFAAESPELEPAALAVIQAGLDRGVAPAAIEEAARLLQAYELMYWDALHAAGT